jgi:uncharacterized membrane protein YhhN
MGVISAALCVSYSASLCFKKEKTNLRFLILKGFYFSVFLRSLKLYQMQVETKTKMLSVTFFVIGILFIVFDYYSVIIPGFISKTLLIPILFFFFISNIRAAYNNHDKLLIASLFFSWAGDVVLEFSGFFIPGLGCFLLAHVMYLTLFFSTAGENSVFGKRWYLLLPVLVSGLLLIGYMYNNLGEMRLPVIIYSVIILTMLTAAINRIDKVNRASYILVLAGAALFVISDSAIAINKFSRHFESSGIVVMTTYITAQYLIVYGYISENKK